MKGGKTFTDAVGKGRGRKRRRRKGKGGPTKKWYENPRSGSEKSPIGSKDGGLCRKIVTGKKEETEEKKPPKTKDENSNKYTL